MRYDCKLIKELREFLFDINYSQLLYMTLGDNVISVDPLPPYTFAKRNFSRCESVTNKLLCFLLLGEEIPKVQLHEYLSQECISYLRDISLLIETDSAFRFNNFVITTYANCYFLVSTPHYYDTCDKKVPSPYIGKDTFWLSRTILNRVKGRVLDLCTGSGIQAIISAMSADCVYAVDIDPNAIDIAIFNSYLNDVNEKTHFLCGDLYEALCDSNNNDRFDYILSNPPFIPVPEDVNYPISGDGGADGFKIIEKIHRGYDEYLKEQGVAMMIGQSIGNENEVFLFEKMKQMFVGKDIKFYAFDKTPLEIQAQNFSKLTNMLRMNEEHVTKEKWLQSNLQFSGSWFYSFLSIVSKSKNEKGVHNLLNVETGWDGSVAPIIEPYNVTLVDSIYRLSDINGNKVEVNEEVVSFLKLIDGKLLLEDLISAMPIKTRLKYGEGANSYLYAKYGKILFELKLAGIIK